MSTPVVVGIDAGQTGVRARTADGRERASGTATTPLVDTAAVDRLVTALAPLTADVPAGAWLGIGLTGYPTDVRVQQHLLDGLYYELSAARITIASDVVTSYLGSVGDGPGVVAVWGTGAVALGSDGAGACQRVDGRGFVLGDLGSGFWIGQQGLRAAMDATEGRGPATTLQEASRRWGGDDLYASVYRSHPLPGHVAGFARTVVEVANSGDDIAGRIIEAAATQLAYSVLAAARAVGIDDASPLVVGVTGGLSSAASAVQRLTTALVETRPGSTTLQVVAAAPLDGAVHLATSVDATERFPGLARTWNRET